MVQYRITTHGIEIIDSYKVIRKKAMREVLNIIIQDPKYLEQGFTRSLKNYIAEWKVHNWCYYLHIMRRSAKDVYLDKVFKTKRGKIEKFIYAILTPFM